jgi:hypothetical protein
MPKIILANGGEAHVDEADVGKVIGYKWTRNGYGYAVTYVPTDSGHQLVMMHRLVVDAKRGQIVDHANGDPLDNRRDNLRFCSHAENMRNSKRRKHNKLGVKGVFVEYPCGRARYRAQIRIDGKKLSLGSYDTIDEAQQAYAEAAKKYHGEFARLD